MKEEGYKVDTTDINNNLSENYNKEFNEQKSHKASHRFLIFLIIIAGACLGVVMYFDIDVIDMLGLKNVESAIDDAVYVEDYEIEDVTTTVKTTKAVTTTATVIQTTNIATTSVTSVSTMSE